MKNIFNPFYRQYFDFLKSLILFIDNNFTLYDTQLFVYCIQVDEHESRTLDDIQEKEPEFYSRVTTVLKRAENDFGL